MTRDEILYILSKHRDELRRDYGVRSLALFGSTARNKTGSESDVDILASGAGSVRLAIQLRIG